jgi:hypothetical protein
MKSRLKENSKNSENIRNVEEKIPPLVFSEFFHYMEDEDALAGEPSDLKRELITMALDGSIESYHKIERMIEDGKLPVEIRDFAAVALNYCRFKIENELLDDPIDMVSGGLGGTANKMRYYLALSGKDGISREQSEHLEQVFREVTEDRDSILEEVRLHDFYVSLLILGSFNYAVGDVVDAGLRECDFLKKDYYLTNVEIPTDERIRDWLDGKLDDDEFSLKT